MGNLTMDLVIAQVVGISAMITFAIVPHQKTRGRSLAFQLLSSILYAMQYLLLGAFSAVASNIIGAIKNYVFYIYVKKNKDIPISILVIYILILLISGILTYTNMLSIFPIVLSIMYAYGAWQSNLRIYRIISVFGAALWIIYNFSVGAYIGVIGNVMQFISAIIAIVRLDIIKKEETEEQVEEKKVTE